MHITQLNDHVLLEILSWLDIFDVISLIKTCKRMQKLEEIYGQRFSTFDFKSIEQHLSLFEVNQLFHLVGKRLIKLNISDIKTKFKNGNAILQAVQKHCLKLQELNLSLPYFSMLKSPLPGGLISLSISNYDIEKDYIAEKNLKGSWESVQIFRMFDMQSLNGNFLDKFRNLQQLQLENCISLSQNNLLNCCRENKTLRKLTILSCPQINETFLQKMCNVLPELEVVHLDVFSKTEKICCSPLNQLANLKAVHIDLIGADLTLFVNSLISTICTIKSLQELYIGGAAKLEPQNIDNFMKMKNLRKLEFFNCAFVNKKLLLKIGENLPLAEVIFTQMQFLNNDALLAFAVKTTSLERLRIMLCPVSVEVKAEIAATIQQCVSAGKRPSLTVDITRAIK